ncbi:MAG: hypothetical protein WCI03_02940 [bacterium]|jgi:hypothetical protein
MKEAFDNLTQALRGFGRFRNRWALLEGLGRFMLAGPGMLLIWVLLDSALLLPSWPLFLLFLSAVGVGAFAAVRWLLPPVFRRIRLDREALEIEARHGQLDNLIIGAHQLGEETLSGKAGSRHSPVLVAALVARATAELHKNDPALLIDLRRPRKILFAAMVPVVVALILAIAAPRLMSDRVVRLREAWLAVLDTLFPVTLTIEPGNVTAVRGDPVTLKVHARGARRTAIDLRMKEADTGRETHQPLTLVEGSAAYTIGQTDKSFTYDFAYAGRRSPFGTILVGERPQLSAISYELVYPAYVGQPPRTLSGRIPRIQALAGTSILVSFSSTTELHPDFSYVEWTGGEKQAITVSGRFGHFSFTVDQPCRASIRLTGRHGRGFEMTEPVNLEIVVDKDLVPTIQVGIRKDKLVMLAEEATAFAVPYTAEDDFGVTEVSLAYRIDTIDAMLGREPRQGSTSRLVEPVSERVNGRFTEAFKALNPGLLPGDRIRVELSARDNNTETGPGVGRSRSLQIVVVRPDLAQFTEKSFGFQQTELLAGLKKVKRATNLLVEPERAVRAEKAQAIDKQKLEARLNSESWPSGAEDAVGDYFRLISGGK